MKPTFGRQLDQAARQIRCSSHSAGIPFILGLELSPAYVDVIVERWQRFTGGVAKLDGDGRDFADLREERTAAFAEPV